MNRLVVGKFQKWPMKLCSTKEVGQEVNWGFTFLMWLTVGNMVVNVCYKCRGQVLRVREVKELQLANMDTYIHQVRKPINTNSSHEASCHCAGKLSYSKTKSLLQISTPLCTMTL